MLKHLIAFFAVMPLFAQAFPSISLEAGFNFNAVARYRGCTAFIFRLKNMPLSQKALLMTNGHCSGVGTARLPKPWQIELLIGASVLPAPEVVVYKEFAHSRQVQIWDKDGQRNAPWLSSYDVLYATATGRDIAIFKLGYTYERLSREFGVEALVLSEHEPASGTEVGVLAILGDKGGKAKEGRGYRCAIDKKVDFVQAGGWVWENSIRLTPECRTVGGTSGGPVVDIQTGKVVALNNARNISGGDSCGVFDPCEWNLQEGKTVTTQAYAQPIHDLYGCFDQKYKFDLSLESCLLPKGEMQEQQKTE